MTADSFLAHVRSPTRGEGGRSRYWWLAEEGQTGLLEPVPKRSRNSSKKNSYENTISPRWRLPESDPVQHGYPTNIDIFQCPVAAVFIVVCAVIFRLILRGRWAVESLRLRCVPAVVLSGATKTPRQLALRVIEVVGLQLEGCGRTSELHMTDLMWRLGWQECFTGRRDGGHDRHRVECPCRCDGRSR